MEASGTSTGGLGGFGLFTLSPLLQAAKVKNNRVTAIVSKLAVNRKLIVLRLGADCISLSFETGQAGWVCFSFPPFLPLLKRL